MDESPHPRGVRSGLALALLLGLFALCFNGIARGEELVYWPRGADPARDAALRKFEEEHPGVRVISSPVAGEMLVYQQRLLCGVAGGSPPDVVLADRFSTAEWASRDAFLPLGNYISASQKEESAARAVGAAIKAGDSAEAGKKLGELIEQLKPLGKTRQLDLAQSLKDGTYDGERTKAAAELVSLCQGIDGEAFYPAVWGESQWGGKTFSIPTDFDDRMLYVNEDLLERAGLVDKNGRAKPPADWKELKEYAIKLTQRDPTNGSIRVLGFAPNYGNSWLYLYGWQNGGHFVSADGKTITLNDPKIVQALQYMKDVYNAIGGVEQVAAFQSSFPGGGALDPFFNGQVAMKIDGSFALTGFSDYAPNLRFRAVPAPSPAGMPQITWTGGYAHAIPVGCKSPALSFEFIRFMASDRITRYIEDLKVRQAKSRGSTYLPISTPRPKLNQEIYDRYVKGNAAIPPRIRDAAATAVELAKVARFRPPTPVGQVLWDEHIRAYEQAVRGKLSPQAALDYGTEVVQRRLNSINRDRALPMVPWWIVWTSVAAVAAVTAIFIYLFGGRRQLLRDLVGAEARTGVLCVSPWVFGFLALTAGPMIASGVLSLSEYDILHGARWVGMENYRILFTSDPLVWKSLLNTTYMILGVPLGMAVGLGIAMILNQEVKGMSVYRTVFYLPAIVPAVASSILWIWILSPEQGLINALLRMVGVAHPPNWLVSDSWLFGSKTGIIVMGLWGAGASMIIWLAGLRDIPTGLYEAASIDGAGPLRQFWNVTLPMLTPYIFFNLLIGIIGTLQIFAQAFIMTQGGPNDSTMFYVYYLFNNAFAYFRMGYASALAWVLFAIILVFTGVQLYFSKKWVQYGAE